jgi:hypothetical protein
LLGDDVFVDGNIDPDALCRAIPAFSAYRVTGQGFSGSPEVWQQSEPNKPLTYLRMADKDDESSSVE